MRYVYRFDNLLRITIYMSTTFRFHQKGFPNFILQSFSSHLHFFRHQFWVRLEAGPACKHKSDLRAFEGAFVRWLSLLSKMYRACFSAGEFQIDFYLFISVFVNGKKYFRVIFQSDDKDYWASTFFSDISVRKIFI